MRLETLLAHPAVQALGWSLLHFLWQGALLALVLWMIKLIVPAKAAQARYAAASFIMLLMPVALFVTLTRGFPQTAIPSGAVPALGDVAAPVAAVEFPFTPSAAGANIGIPGWAVCFWIAGVLLLSSRAAGGWMRARRLIRHSIPATDLEQLLTRMKNLLRVSAPVRLLESTMVEVPTVIGWLRPCVLLPITALTGLSESQLEAVLAHELAHIRRHDYIVNLLQTAIETLLFYHPAVWWVGRQMRIEREHCCDDIAVAVCGSASDYARALAELEQIRGGSFEPALAATGGDLLARIRRVLGQQPGVDRVSRALGSLAAATLVLLITAVPALRSQNAPAPPHPTPPEPPSISIPAPVIAIDPATAARPDRPRGSAQNVRPPSLSGPSLSDIALSDLDATLQQTQLALVQRDRAMAQFQQSLAAQELQQEPRARTPEESAKTVDFLIKLFDSEKNIDMKESVLHYLASSDDQRAADKLLSIARTDPNQDLRMAAVTWIAREAKSYDALVSLYDGEKDPQTKTAVLSWLARSQDPRAADKLMSIVQSDSNVEVRQAALNWLVKR
jgi:beta-lactamase regulating signal transducer with metallopeptidase domain